MHFLLKISFLKAYFSYFYMIYLKSYFSLFYNKDFHFNHQSQKQTVLWRVWGNLPSFSYSCLTIPSKEKLEYFRASSTNEISYIYFVVWWLNFKWSCDLLFINIQSSEICFCHFIKQNDSIDYSCRCIYVIIFLDTFFCRLIK